MHAEILRGKYDVAGSDLSVTLAGGPFNCATATALFLALAERFDLAAQAVSVVGHVWCRVTAGDEFFDVETTCPDWFAVAQRARNSARYRRCGKNMWNAPLGHGRSTNGRFWPYFTTTVACDCCASGNSAKRPRQISRPSSSIHAASRRTTTCALRWMNRRGTCRKTGKPVRLCGRSRNVSKPGGHPGDGENLLDFAASRDATRVISRERVSKPLLRRGQSHFSPRTTKNWDSPRRF